MVDLTLEPAGRYIRIIAIIALLLGLFAITYFVEQAYDTSGVELFEQQVIPAFIEQERHGNLWHFMHGR